MDQPNYMELMHCCMRNLEDERRKYGRCLFILNLILMASTDKQMHNAMEVSREFVSTMKDEPILTFMRGE